MKDQTLKYILTCYCSCQVVVKLTSRMQQPNILRIRSLQFRSSNLVPHFATKAYTELSNSSFP